MVPLLLELPPEVLRRSPNREPVVVTVGRIVPNKRLDDVVKAFALYQRRHAPEASLVIVGSDVGFESYRHALEVLIARIGVQRVFFTGAISSEARDAWYRRADVYLSMSVHEGFCAPLIEALAHGVPVVARGAGAVPETLGGAGVVLEEADYPRRRGSASRACLVAADAKRALRRRRPAPRGVAAGRARPAHPVGPRPRC